MVEIEVDTETGRVRVLKMTTAVDAGPVINPQNLTGQLEGGMDMESVLPCGRNTLPAKTHDWKTFKFPTIESTLISEVIIRKHRAPKARWELPVLAKCAWCPTAPAVINAIKNAIGVWICDLPATPAKIKAALAAV